MNLSFIENLVCKTFGHSWVTYWERSKDDNGDMYNEEWERCERCKRRRLICAISDEERYNSIPEELR